MHAILMAAGIGSRLGTKEKSKCMWEVGGMPLIEHTIKMLLENDVSVSIVTGYKAESIQNAMKDYDIHWYYNPFYRVTNSIGSLWFAREQLEKKEDLILASADVFWDSELLDLLKNDEHEATILGDSTRCEVGDYFFQTENGFIKKYGKAKDMPISIRSSENLGVARIKTSFLDGFRNRMNTLISEEQYNIWWENVLYNYCDEYPVYVKDVNGHFWGEIDCLSDYERIAGFLDRKL